MSLIGDTAELFKAKGVPIERWYKDDNGRYGFRVTVDGDTFYVAALSQVHKDGQISVMRRLVARAVDNDAMLLVRIRDERLVFNPESFEQRGEERAITDERRKRGERWLHVPKDWGVDFRDYMDGKKAPDTSHGDLRDYGVGV